VAFECLLDLVAGVEEGSAGGEVADDAGVGAGVAGGGDPAGELVDREAAAGALEHAVLGELVGDGERVDRLMALVQGEHRLVDEGVLVAVEVLGVEVFLERDRLQGLLSSEQDRAEHAALGLEVVRRNKSGGAGHGHHDRAGSGSGQSSCPIVGSRGAAARKGPSCHTSGISGRAVGRSRMRGRSDVRPKSV